MPTRYQQPLSDRRVQYGIEVRLDPERKTLEGHETITWRNPDRVPVDELQFHLYLNAFRNRQSTFMRESGDEFRGTTLTDPKKWGNIQIQSLHLASQSEPTTGIRRLNTDLTAQLRFIQPDDGNLDDRTVASVKLPKPIPAGGEVTLSLTFQVKIPMLIARTGWGLQDDDEPFFMIAQWFPKLGVYEVPGQRYLPAHAPRGAWNTHQFHANSEFYADFGTYDVRITLPERFVVGATGLQTEQHTTKGLKTLRFRAEDVHDFAWTASPTFREYTTQWKHVKIRALVQPQHAEQGQQHLDAALLSLTYYQRWIGEYPYTTLTLVDGLGEANGMEYPTLITCGTRYGTPDRVRMLMLVTLHEFGHQYWYGMLANNEFEEAWLDEGINSYVEQRIMDDAFGAGSVLDLPGFPVSDAAFQRLGYTKEHPERGAIVANAWSYVNDADYGKCSYRKPAVMLASLERKLGKVTMARLMRTYYQRWRFKHPTTRDFIALAEEVSEQSLEAYFQAFWYRTDTVDFAVAKLQGATVKIRQLGTAQIPVRIRFTLDQGKIVEEVWDGQNRETIFKLPASVQEVWIDPEDTLWMDINRLNNRKTRDADPTFAEKYYRKLIVWAQQALNLV